MMRILIAGIGNVFLGDDGFGVEVVRQLAARELPEGVRVVDFGIRGVDLTYALLDAYDAAILVDVTKRGGPPGTLYVLDLDTEPGWTEATNITSMALEAHAMDPATVLRVARTMGGSIPCLRLVGCEPQTFDGGREGAIALSACVQASVVPAVSLVETLVSELAVIVREMQS